MSLNNVKQAVISGNRYVALNADASIFVKEGVNGSWINITQTSAGNLPAMKSVAVCGNRVVGLTISGQVYGTSPASFEPTSWNGVWTPLLTDQTTQIALAENRIFALKTNGEVWLKEGDWNAGWTALMFTQSIQYIAADGNRLVAITTSGQVYGWDGQWSALLTDNTKQLSLAANRIFALKNDGQIWVKEGGFGAGWQIITHTPVAAGNLPPMQFIASQDSRLLAITNNREVYGTSPASFNPSSWNGIWSPVLINQAVDVAVYSDQILVVQENGALMLKQGSWGAGWVALN